jgi:hypothetical protein
VPMNSMPATTAQYAAPLIVRVFIRQPPIDCPILGITRSSE